MRKKLIITVSVILCLLVTATVIYRINYKKQVYDYNEELYVSNEEYDITVYPPVNRENSAHEYMAFCEMRLNPLYEDISNDEYYSKMNETVCSIIDDVYSYIAEKNISEKFRIYIKTEAQKNYYTFEFYNYCDIFDFYGYSNNIDETARSEFNAEMESVGVSGNFISCAYRADIYENAVSKKYAIELLNSLKIKYLRALGNNTVNLNLAELDYSDFEKLKSITLLVTSNFIVSEDIYQTLAKSGMIDDSNNNSYKVDCSERDDLDWYFEGYMSYK
ncbi:MAG: hypothetical protein NC253_00240 [Ruminococcus sp.]|nr:hypothetical protein [Ruminococcus sp.]MCM1382808.1 hypothetical protein [Muribaculaceae bacterium]MCM1480845.1 hypothetical protein [Muribaculaceae bacterium]